MGNAGLNVIAKSSLLESMYIIKQEKTPLQNGRHGSNVVIFFIWDYFCAASSLLEILRLDVRPLSE